MQTELEMLYTRQSGSCFWCGEKMLPLGSAANLPLSPTIDHVIPKGTGRGGHDNKRAACYECNTQRNLFNRATYEKQRQDQEKQIHRLKTTLVTQDKEIKRLSSVLLNHFIDPWWRRFGRWMWKNLCIKYYGKEQSE